MPEKDVLPVSKQLALTLISNATELLVSGAEVNLTSASTFFHAWSSATGIVHWEERWGRGNVSLQVFVSAQGFIASQHQLELPCPRNIDQPCSYNRTLRLYPLPPPEQDKENVTCSSTELSLVVIEPSGRKLPGVDISLTLVSNITNSTTGHYIDNVNGTSNLETEVGHAASDADGSFSWPITLNGHYRLSLKKKDWENKILEAEISNCSSKTLEVTMEKIVNCEVDLIVHVVDQDENAVNGANLFFAVDPSQNNFNLTTSAPGKVSTRLPPGPLQIQALASGSFPALVDVDLQCGPELTNSSKVVVITMRSLPPTVAPSCYDDLQTPVLLTVSVTDLLTGNNLEGFVGTLTIRRDNEILAIFGNLSIVDGWNYPVEMDGTYTLKGLAPGYLPANGSVDVACGPSSCESCMPHIELKLRQEPCQNELLQRVAVRDTSLLPLQNAAVEIFLVTADGKHRPVSPLLQCAEDGQLCGDGETTEEECKIEGCCWKSEPDFAGREAHPFIMGRNRLEDSRGDEQSQKISNVTLSASTLNPITTIGFSTTLPPTLTTVFPPQSSTTRGPVITTISTSIEPNGRCLLPSGNSSLLTDDQGLVASSLPGRGSFLVKSSMGGFTTLEETIVVDLCEPSIVDLTLTPIAMCDNEGMELEINVVKALTNEPIHNATVQVFLVHGETQVLNVWK